MRRASPSAASDPCPQASQSERALKEFACGACRGVLQQPLVMPCGHKFCRPCLLAKVLPLSITLFPPRSRAIPLILIGMRSCHH